MAKRPFIRKQKRKKHGATFWDNEYTKGGNLKLSTEVGEDLAKFTRWLSRETGKEILNPTASVLDMGCGNGRNLIFLAKNFGMRDFGYDISSAAIAEAKRLSSGLPVSYETRSMAGDIPLSNESQEMVLDMMASHFLNENERTHLHAEVFRVLKPGGWFFIKTFLRDGDLYTERLLKEYPGKEDGTYIHPVIGVPEHVYFEDELIDALEKHFVIHKVYRSHKHVFKGKAQKRRTISIYAQKDPYR